MSVIIYNNKAIAIVTEDLKSGKKVRVAFFRDGKSLSNAFDAKISNAKKWWENESYCYLPHAVKFFGSDNEFYIGSDSDQVLKKEELPFTERERRVAIRIATFLNEKLEQKHLVLTRSVLNLEKFNINEELNLTQILQIEYGCTQYQSNRIADIFTEETLN